GKLCSLADDGETFTCEFPEFTWNDDLLLGTYEELAIWAKTWTPDFWEEWDGLPEFGGLFADDEMLFDEEGNIIGFISEDGEELFFEDMLPGKLGDFVPGGDD